MMKKVLLVALVLAAPAAYANDVSPGAVQVTGGSNLGFTAGTQKFNGSKADFSGYGLSASGAYYLTNAIGVGLEIETSHSTFKPEGGTESKSDSFLFGPKLVLDVPLAEKTAFFADLTIGLAQEKDDISTMNGYGFAVGAGVKFFLARSFSVDLGLQYTKTHLSGDGDTYDGAGLSLGAALSVYFNNAGH